MNKRYFHVVKIFLLLLLILISYYFLNKYLGFSIPCVFNLITGYKCPGCGITHLFFDLINLKIKDAFFDNPLVFIYLPFIISYFIYESYLYIYDKKDNIIKKIPNYVWIILVVITLIYGVIRNIYNI